MVDAGVLDETRALLARGLDPSLPSLSGHGYIHWSRHLGGALTLNEATALTVRDTRRYSRRQMTWFRRDGAIRWIDPTVEDPMAAAVARP
jgi:tRNA dimethylallyltransferase